MSEAPDKCPRCRCRRTNVRPATVSPPTATSVPSRSCTTCCPAPAGGVGSVLLVEECRRQGDSMKFTSKKVLLVLAVVVGVGLAGAYFWVVFDPSPVSPAAYAQIRLGMTEGEVQD